MPFFLFQEVIFRYFFYALGALRLVELVDLGYDDNVLDSRLIHPIEHHSVVTGDARAAVDKLNDALYEIDILIFGEVSVGQA